MRKTILLVFILSLISLKSYSQFSISAGPSIIKGFGVAGVYPGFHISGEMSNDDVQTIYARLLLVSSKKGESFPTAVSSISQQDTPFNIELNAREKYNYTLLELGKRYYFGEGYESGFGAYGGTTLGIVFNKISYEFDSYDEVKYKANFATKGSIIGLAGGLSGGIKNSFNFGTIFLDAGINYTILSALSSADLAQPEQFRSLFFSVNIGIRKDFY